MASASNATPLVALRVLSRRFPTIDATLAEIGHLRAVLTLPKGTVHVVSDVHGEHKKLKHIVNNASGSLRPLVESLFAERISESELRTLLSIVYYPRETYASARPNDAAERARFVEVTVEREVEILRALSRRHSRRHVEKVYPPAFAGLLRELVASRAPEDGRAAFHAALVEPLLRAGKEIDLLRALAHAIRNLSVEELVVAGDLGDRGPRLDRVVDFLMRQRSVSIVWGNHDALWMGACLGHDALIATVLRVSIRYRRLSQLEEGYGITMAPVEKLAREVYGDDSADCFGVKGEGLRELRLMRQMQKAMAVIQLKLEGQLARRHPEWALEERCLLHRLDVVAGTILIGDTTHALLDRSFPTLDPADPYALSVAEHACMERLRASFLASPTLWQQMSFLERRGHMAIVRDRALIFHGCVPVGDDGAPLSLVVDGEPRAGRALFEAFERVVRRAFRDKAPSDLDMLWYLWSGPCSPLFGKDKMATFESYLVADPEARAEHKNPYFRLLHEAPFCARICQELGGDFEDGLIVNGHVPVKLDRGESPVKRSGRAVTIDGAFSEAYGDRGYTLILDARGTSLAQHHHFASVKDSVETGSDVIPTIQHIERYEPPRTIGDTETGARLRDEIAVLESLVLAYQAHEMLEA